MQRNIADWINKIRSGQNPGYAILIVGPQGAGKGMLSAMLAAQTGLPLAEAASGVDYVKWVQEPKDRHRWISELLDPQPGARGMIIESDHDGAVAQYDQRLLVIRLEGVDP